MEKVIVLPDVEDMLLELVNILFREEYFSFRQSAKDYVNEIIDFIYTIPTQRKKATHRNRYGNWYCAFKINKHTTWYISFNVEGEEYNITYITNNHTADYPRYIRGIK